MASGLLLSQFPSLFPLWQLLTPSHWLRGKAVIREARPTERTGGEGAQSGVRRSLAAPVTARHLGDSPVAGQRGEQARVLLLPAYDPGESHDL